MARPKKTELQKLADRATALGIDLSDVELPSQKLDTEDDKALEAEATLLYFDLKGRGFEHQTCPECGQEFAYKYQIKMRGMRCSNRCRKAGLEARGLSWSPGRSLEARWAAGSMKGNIPFTVPPEALSALREVMPEDA